MKRSPVAPAHDDPKQGGLKGSNVQERRPSERRPCGVSIRIPSASTKLLLGALPVLLGAPCTVLLRDLVRPRLNHFVRHRHLLALRLGRRLTHRASLKLGGHPFVAARGTRVLPGVGAPKPWSRTREFVSWPPHTTKTPIWRPHRRRGRPDYFFAGILHCYSVPPSSRLTRRCSILSACFARPSSQSPRRRTRARSSLATNGLTHAIC